MGDGMILILEDEYQRIEQFKQRYPDALITQNAAAVIALLKICHIDLLSLDFDMGTPTIDNDGGKVSAFLREHPEYMPDQVIIHSWNPVGRRRMLQDIPGAIVAPFECEKTPADL